GTLEASPQRTTVTTHDNDLDHEHGAVLMDLTARLQDVANAMWMPVIGLAIVMGLYFTIRTKVLQIRLFPQMLRELKGDGDTEPGGLTPFQALALTIGNRVGVGNIAGVATAIGWGGPGALFWMGVMAFCGGATAFVESTLAQIYKERINNELKGGVPYYLHKVFQKRWIGMIAAVTALLLYIILAPGSQSNSIAVTAANSNSPRGRRAIAEAEHAAAEICPDVSTTAAAVAHRSRAKGLIAEAERSAASMIVLGSGTEGTRGRIRVSATSDRLLHSAPLPVALAPRGFTAEAGAQIERVTCSFRGDRGS